MVSSASEPSSPAPPPSVRIGEPLLASYTYSSTSQLPDEVEDDGAEVKDEKGKQRAAREDEEWMMGIDEAGRGPVLGPLVYGVAFCPVAFSDTLDTMGFTDSKALTAARREELLEALKSEPGKLEWSVRVMSPVDISAGMLRKSPYNLNAQSFDATCTLIRHALTCSYNLRHIYVDTVGPPAAYSAKLSAAFPGIAFTVCSKADAIYPIVGAASIAAKVTRDAVLEAWVYPEEELQVERNLKRRLVDGEPTLKGPPEKGIKTWSRSLGSGYPSDPNTVAWLDSSFDPVFGFPQIARFSWGTVKNLFETKGAKCRWEDEPKNIQKWFSKADQEKEEMLAGGKLEGPWKETGLRSVAVF